MKRHLTFLLCSTTGLLSWNAAHAMPSPLEQPAPARSYADLLEPIPNAVEALLADELSRARQPKPLVQLAQYYHHHHHHHHHGYFEHHHHHHHHHGYFGGGIVVAPPAYGYGSDCYIQRRIVTTAWGERVVRRVQVCD